MSKFKINKGIVTQKTGDKITIFDGEKSLLYTFNRTGSFIFKKIKSRQSTEVIVSALAKNYLINENEARKDLDEFIEDLKKRNIITNIPKT